MSRIDISEPIRQICEHFGLNPEDVAHIDFRPTHATVIAFKRNENGSIYLESGEAATETHEFEIST